MLLLTFLRSFRPVGSNFGLHQRRFSMTVANQVEHFIDKEFEKARSNLDTDALENPKALLQKLERDQKWRIEVMKRARTKRLFKQPAEPRTLTWDTMEQIRYLKQENSDEWTVQKLAYTFDVTEALIIKVLKSKFAPSEKRIMKMDDKARINTGLLPERTATMTSEMSDPKALPSAFSKAQPTDMTPVVNRPITNAGNNQAKPYSRRRLSHNESHTLPLALRGQRSTDKSTKQQVPKIHQIQKYSGNEIHVPPKGVKDSSPHDITANNIETSKDRGFVQQRSLSSKSKLPRGVKYINDERNMESDVDESEFQDELYIDMENLDSYNDGTRPPQIIRKGNEFFDENGEFLYRV